MTQEERDEISREIREALRDGAITWREAERRVFMECGVNELSAHYIVRGWLGDWE